MTSDAQIGCQKVYFIVGQTDIPVMRLLIMKFRNIMNFFI